MEKSVWLWMRAYWQVIVTLVVIAWFLAATLTHDGNMRRLARSESNDATGTASQTLEQQIIAQDRPTTTVLTSSTVAPLASTSSTTIDSNRTYTPRRSGVDSGYVYDGTNSKPSQSARYGSLEFRVKSLDAHPIENSNGKWEVNAMVEVKNTSKSTVTFDPTRISSQIGGGVIFPKKPVNVDIAPAMPVLVPVSFHVNGRPSLSSLVLMYNGVILPRDTDSLFTAR